MHEDGPMPVTPQATFCATLVDEWARAGVRHAVIAPGSRSTPLALALTADERIAIEVFHDERAAGFAALGIGLATGVPAVLLCTSGTAATHFHAAVIEADLSGIPMLVCTADRPPELRDVGAPQAIDQRDLYGRAVRWFFDPGVADKAMQGSWRAIAAQAVLAAASRPYGPVHLNLPFRDPLVGEPGRLPAGRRGGAPWTVRPIDDPGKPLLEADRVFVVSDATVGIGLAAHLDAILRHAPTAEALRPDAVVRYGRPPASRVVNEWVATCGAEEHVVAAAPSDPARTATALHTRLDAQTGPEYALAWARADEIAESAIAETLAGFDAITEPAAARAFIGGLPTGANAIVASSMPIRDVEWFAPRRTDVSVRANRGANGIDGTIATAIGFAVATRAPTAVLLGDVAFLHDSTALIGVKARGVDLTIVVIDNDGGGIFSFLPQASALGNERFELLFGTPHGVKPEELAAAHGIASLTVEDPTALEPAIRSTASAGGVWLVVARTDRAANVKAHDALNAAVATALERDF
ncbi:MAG: 2-succinyl-5-enolpyruvyl-6-hydroxy-3-cyclohexene-carboxylate synthase [Acidimicrobiaceae bacterium]